MIWLTIACPETLIADANHLAMVLGEGASDARTYGAPSWRDAAGNRYALASFMAPLGWIAAAQAPLQRPDWDQDQAIDIAAAQRAQAAMVVVQDTVEGGTMAAEPHRIVALAGAEADAASALLGLTRIPPGPDPA